MAKKKKKTTPKKKVAKKKANKKIVAKKDTAKKDTAKKIAVKKSPSKKSTPSKPTSFTGCIRERSASVKRIAKALQTVILEELPTAQEDYYGGQLPMAMYRTTAEVCWIQPLKDRCNIYFMRGPDLTDSDGFLQGNSDRHRFARVNTLEHVEQLPIRDWLRESVALNAAATFDGLSFDQVLVRLQTICLALPNTKETMTWGKPHFRVGEKIFCGVGEDQGRPSIGLKMEVNESHRMMKLPGIEKAAYSRPNDGWVKLDPFDFDDWEEIERLIGGSFRLIAPKRTIALLD
jgi:predicted DNA-binding protein (MmcQ/YjbR family)